MRYFLLGAGVLLTSCAVTPLPDLPPSHPASPLGAEAAVWRASDSLAPDAATRRTDSLLAPAKS